MLCHYRIVAGLRARIASLEAENAALKLTGNENAVNCDAHSQSIAYIPASGPCPACAVEAENAKLREEAEEKERVAVNEAAEQLRDGLATYEKRRKLEAKVEALEAAAAKDKERIEELHRQIGLLGSEPHVGPIRSLTLKEYEDMRAALSESQERVKELEERDSQWNEKWKAQVDSTGVWLERFCESETRVKRQDGLLRMWEENDGAGGFRAISAQLQSELAESRAALRELGEHADELLSTLGSVPDANESQHAHDHREQVKACLHAALALPAVKAALEPGEIQANPTYTDDTTP